MNPAFGQFGYEAGTSGTATIPLGATITSIRAQSADAAGAVTIFGGDAIPVPAAAANWRQLDLRFTPGEVVTKTGAQDVVFANTVSFLVTFLKAPNAADV